MNKKYTKNYLTWISAFVLVTLVSLVIYIAKEYYDMTAFQKQYEQNLSETHYNYHCAFITNSSRDAFHQSIYDAARDQGSLSGIYVEDFGKNLYVTYSTDELMKMAIAANVDAIILESTGKSSTTKLIDEAVDKGIAVSTIYKDDMESKRFSYTGINNVSVGYDYGSLAIEYSSSKDTSIMVLLDSEEPAAERRLLTSGIGKALTDLRPDARLETMTLDSTNTFEVEEEIRQFLKDNHDTTNVVICTNLVQTQFVSQAAVDLNYVGDFTIIGSYQNYSVLESLKNGVISANIEIDSEQMGRKAVENLEEYFTYGHTSDYSQVDFHTIKKEDAITRLAELDAGETDETGGISNEE